MFLATETKQERHEATDSCALRRIQKPPQLVASFFRQPEWRYAIA